MPACCNIAGLDTPHKRFFKRLIVGGSLFALGSFLMQWLTLHAIPLPLILFAMPLLLGVTGEISPLHGRLLPGTLIAAIFTLSLIGRMPIYVPRCSISAARYGTGCLTGSGSGCGKSSQCAKA